MYILSKCVPDLAREQQNKSVWDFINTGIVRILQSLQYLRLKFSCQLKKHYYKLMPGLAWVLGTVAVSILIPAGQSCVYSFLIISYLNTATNA